MAVPVMQFLGSKLVKTFWIIQFWRIKNYSLKNPINSLLFCLIHNVDIWFNAFQLFLAIWELLADLRQIHNHAKKYFKIVQLSLENDNESLSESSGTQVCLLWFLILPKKDVTNEW